MIEKMCNQMLHTYNSKASHVGQHKVRDSNALSSINMIAKMCNQMLHKYSKAAHVGQRKVGGHDA